MQNDLVFDTEFWKVILHEDQYYLGRAVVVLQRPCPALSGNFFILKIPASELCSVRGYSY